MFIKCNHDEGACPCLVCAENCCAENYDKEKDQIDTDVLCKRAKEYCEAKSSTAAAFERQ